VRRGLLMSGLSGHRWRKVVEWVRANWPWVCWICHKPIPVDAPARSPMSHSVDHVVPRSRGGDPYNLDNCRPAHYGCNSAKGNRPVQQWLTSPDW
jgi:hypothetical protein